LLQAGCDISLYGIVKEIEYNILHEIQFTMITRELNIFGWVVLASDALSFYASCDNLLQISANILCDNFHDWLKQRASQPICLMELSRLAIRSRLKISHPERSILPHIQCIKAPKGVIDYLSFTEFEQL